jgi:hypothetical protein
MDNNNRMKPVYDALDAIAQGIVKDCYNANGLEVPAYGLLIHKKKGAYGYAHRTENWEVNDKGMREVGITPECLMKGKDEIFTTLAHEFVHVHNNGVKGTPDCSGKRHNNIFAEVCDTIGLKYERGVPKVYIYTPSQWNDVFEKIYVGLSDEHKDTITNIKTILDMDKEAKPKKDRNLAVFVCPECGAKARAKPEANLLCGDCSCEDELIRMVSE